LSIQLTQYLFGNVISSQDKAVTIAAMDTTAHNPPAEYKIEGFPTIMFLPNGDRRKLMPYEGPRDAKHMVEFVQQHRSTSPLKQVVAEL
jgi:hypothetical protein